MFRSAADYCCLDRIFLDLEIFQARYVVIKVFFLRSSCCLEISSNCTIFADNEVELRHKSFFCFHLFLLIHV